MRFHRGSAVTAPFSCRSRCEHPIRSGVQSRLAGKSPAVVPVSAERACVGWEMLPISSGLPASRRHSRAISNAVVSGRHIESARRAGAVRCAAPFAGHLAGRVRLTGVPGGGGPLLVAGHRNEGSDGLLTVYAGDAPNPDSRAGSRAGRLMTTRIVVAENNLLVREGLRRMHAPAAGFQVAVCRDLAESIMAVDRHRPDVVLTDIRVPPARSDEGSCLAAHGRRMRPAIGVLVLSHYIEASYLGMLLAPGIEGRGCLLKVRVAGLPELTHAVARGVSATVLERRRPRSDRAAHARLPRRRPPAAGQGPPVVAAVRGHRRGPGLALHPWPMILAVPL